MTALTNRGWVPKLPIGGRGVDRGAKNELMARLEDDALRICARFRLRYRVLEAERGNVKRRYGVCFSDGTIRIRLRHATSGKALKYSSLVNTLCHELAHLRHFNHGPGFQDYYARILEWARREGIYNPSRSGTSAAPPSVPVFSSTPLPERIETLQPREQIGGARRVAVATGQLELFG